MARFENLKIEPSSLLILFGILVMFLGACESRHENTTDSDIQNEAATLENPFIHSVYFWFKEGVTEAQLTAFYEDSKGLAKISSVKGLFYGKPAPTDRPIVENSYDFSVVVHFENLEGHDVYQQDKIHLDLLAKHSGIWEKVMVTDVSPH